MALREEQADALGPLWAVVTLLVPVLVGDQVCLKCGCTEFDACDEGCGWVEEDLCSACV